MLRRYFTYFSDIKSIYFYFAVNLSVRPVILNYAMRDPNTKETIRRYLTCLIFTGLFLTIKKIIYWGSFTWLLKVHLGFCLNRWQRDLKWDSNTDVFMWILRNFQVSHLNFKHRRTVSVSKDKYYEKELFHDSPAPKVSEASM